MTAQSLLPSRAELLVRFGGDDDLLREIAGLLLRDCPRLLAELHGALARGDFTTVQNTAHSLKGAIANVGAEPAVEAAYQVEQAARSRDESYIKSAAATLDEVLALLLAQLQALCQHESS